jgi:hypothetical protein
MSKYASLTAGILARKGEAEPTSTPFADQMLTRVGCPAPEIAGLTPMHGHTHVHAEPGPAKHQGLAPRRQSRSTRSDRLAVVMADTNVSVLPMPGLFAANIPTRKSMPTVIAARAPGHRREAGRLIMNLRRSACAL